MAKAWPGVRLEMVTSGHTANDPATMGGRRGLRTRLPTARSLATANKKGASSDTPPLCLHSRKWQTGKHYQDKCRPSWAPTLR